MVWKPILEGRVVYRISQSVKPDFFKTNTNFNWILEVSFDLTESLIISGKFVNRRFAIQEYEVENKYYDQQAGTVLLDQFESDLQKKLNVKKEYNSKYRQIVNSLDKAE